MVAAAGAGVLALIFAWIKARSVARAEVGTDRMAEIAGYIQEGAMAFLGRQYRVLSIFIHSRWPFCSSAATGLEARS